MYLKTASDHLLRNGLYVLFQSAYLPFDSCETALVKICSNVFEDLASESYVLMTLLHFNTMFETVDLNILIRRLKTEYGVEGVAIKW